METNPVVDYTQLEELHPEIHADRIVALRDRLSQIYVGNADGQTLASQMFERALARIRPRDEVRGVYVLAGKRSTAKKTLVNCITQVIHGSPERRIMINCRQLNNPWSVLRLVDSNILNDGMPMMPGMPGMPRRVPAVPLLSQENFKKVRAGSTSECTIVCLDHFQAASEFLIQLLQRIFFDGFLSLDDANKTKIDFRDVIWVMLVDTDDAPGSTGLAQDEHDTAVSSVKKLLGDELMEHVDGIAVCRPFSQSEQKRVLDMTIAAFADDVRSRVGCEIIVDDAGRRFLLDRIAEGKGRGSDVTNGLTEHVIRPINVEELKGNLRKGRTVYITSHDGKRLSFHVADSALSPEQSGAAGASGRDVAAIATTGGALPDASAAALTTGDTTAAAAEDNQPRVRNRFSIAHTFDTEEEAAEWRDKILSALSGLGELDKAEKIKKTLREFQGKWMLRVEFVTSGQGFAAVTKDLPDWGQGAFLMYPL